jgi:hypothetical protein
MVVGPGVNSAPTDGLNGASGGRALTAKRCQEELPLVDGADLAVQHWPERGCCGILHVILGNNLTAELK